jgi:hypothetical protein
MKKKIVHEEPPYYAYFQHDDGSWYMLWMTQTDPKTERGHEWHVHASYDKYGSTSPNLESKWYERPYGTANWDFDSLESAIDHFYKERFLLRLKHGYELIMANIPEEWIMDE